MSDKIKPQHLARKAIVYVRQSSAHQVHHNLESQRLQYAMQDRLHHLGWRDIDVVDEDLGRSAAGTVRMISVTAAAFSNTRSECTRIGRPSRVRNCLGMEPPMRRPRPAAGTTATVRGGGLTAPS